MSPPESILQFKFYSSRKISPLVTSRKWTSRREYENHQNSLKNANFSEFCKYEISLIFNTGNAGVFSPILNENIDIDFLRAIFVVIGKFVLSLGREMRVITLLLDAYSKVRSSFKLL